MRQTFGANLRLVLGGNANLSYRIDSPRAHAAPLPCQNRFRGFHHLWHPAFPGVLVRCLRRTHRSVCIFILPRFSCECGSEILNCIPRDVYHSVLHKSHLTKLIPGSTPENTQGSQLMYHLSLITFFTELTIDKFSLRYVYHCATMFLSMNAKYTLQCFHLSFFCLFPQPLDRII